MTTKRTKTAKPKRANVRTLSVNPALKERIDVYARRAGCTRVGIISLALDALALKRKDLHD